MTDGITSSFSCTSSIVFSFNGDESISPYESSIIDAEGVFLPANIDFFFLYLSKPESLNVTIWLISLKFSL